MKLVLYSGYDDENAAIDAEAVRMMERKNPFIVFIPSANHIPDFEFEYVRETFAEHGVRNITQFNLDRPHSPKDLEQVVAKADMIYLSGGNTFYFLKSVRQSQFDQYMIRFLDRGGVLAGLSAGAILMTPSIMTASYPSFDRDENLVELKNLTALNLVPFEFFPHFSPEPEYAKELKRQSKQINHPIYGVSDGGGITINHSRLSFFGNVWGYVNGHQFLVNQTKPVRKRKPRS